MARACLAAASSDFDGTHPKLRQSPPMRPFSTSTTGTPKAAAAAATDRPPEPAPMTQMSGLSNSAMPVLQAGRSGVFSLGFGARLPPPNPLGEHGQQREQTEPNQRSKERGGEQARRLEVDPAIDAGGGKAGLVGRLLRGDHTVEPGAEEGEDEGGRNDSERGRR